jgi:hypothetical protein
LARGVAHEAKVGYVRYEQRYVDQILKDAEIVGRRIEDIESAHWHFFRSSVTGRVGADPRILDLLRECGIGYTIYN